MRERNKFPISAQLLLVKENKILLMKRKNTGYGDGKYCFPGGHVEADEEIRQAAVREAKEEIGIDINKEDLELYKILNRKIEEGGEYIDFIFKVKKWTGDVTNEESEKCEEIVWKDINNIPENILDFIPEILKENNSIYVPYNWKED